MGIQDFLQFLLQYFGIKCGNTPQNTGQCVGEVSLWMDKLGIQHEWGDAKDLLNNADATKFDVIKNTPTGFPHCGDIIVWGSTWGAGSGHTALVIVADANNVIVLEQNNPAGSPPIVGKHTYSGVLGWLHPNSLPQDPQSIIDELRTARDANYNSYQAELTKNNTLASQLQDEQNKNQQLREANDSLTGADSATGAELLDVSHERDDYLNRLNSIKDALPSPSISLVDLLSTIDNLRKPTDDILATTQAQLSECFANLQTSKITTFKQWLSYGWNLLTHK